MEWDKILAHNMSNKMLISKNIYRTNTNSKTKQIKQFDLKLERI